MPQIYRCTSRVRIDYKNVFTNKESSMYFDYNTKYIYADNSEEAEYRYERKYFYNLSINKKNIYEIMDYYADNYSDDYIYKPAIYRCITNISKPYIKVYNRESRAPIMALIKAMSANEFAKWWYDTQQNCID